MSDKSARVVYYTYIYTSGGRAWQAEVGSISREIAVQFGKRARAARFTRARHVHAAALRLHNVPVEKHARAAGYLRGNRLATRPSEVVAMQPRLRRG